MSELVPQTADKVLVPGWPKKDGMGLKPHLSHLKHLLGTTEVVPLRISTRSPDFSASCAGVGTPAPFYFLLAIFGSSELVPFRIAAICIWRCPFRTTCGGQTLAGGGGLEILLKK